jgi:Xaa-Pro aminopeptidase
MKLIHEIRAVKSKKEVENIVKAQRISERVLGDVLEILKKGITEVEVRDFIVKSFTKYRAPILSFEPIVAFGKNTANIHHQNPTRNKLKKGDTIMFDFGCTVNHYCSDMSRTYFFGKPNQKQEKLYKAVLEVQELVISRIAKGERRAKVLDKLARNFLNKKFKIKEKDKMTDGFIHGLGHGVGTVIHEWPNLKPESEDILPVGCVVTVEPGLYFKGFGGVRIEDMILITKKGCENLTKVPKNIKSMILR